MISIKMRNRYASLTERTSARDMRPRHHVQFPAATYRKAILKALAPLGAGVTVIAPLPERLLGLIEGSLRPQSSFEYVYLVVKSL